MVDKICITCKKSFEVYLYRQKTAKFCSHKCLGEWRHINTKGYKSPYWNRETKECTICKKQFSVPQYRKSALYCSIVCKGIESRGKKWNGDRQKMSEIKKGQQPHEMTEKTKRKISKFMKRAWKEGNVSTAGLFKKGHIPMSKTNPEIMPRGNSHPNWKGGSEFWKNCSRRGDGAYQNFVKKVKRRDKNICQLKDEDCKEYNIVHHIKSWRDFPRLRYDVKNGITLCHFHHPRKRKEEKQFIPIFQKLLKQKI